MAVSRRTLRRDVLRDLGDFRALKATADGTDVTLIDHLNLVGEVGAFASRELLFTDGGPANAGAIRHVNYSSAAERAISWTLPLPADTLIGQEAEMINFRGTGFHFDDVHAAINRAIRSVKDRALVPALADVGDYARGESIPLPPEFVTVENVQAQSSWDETVWDAIPRAPRPNGHGWWVDRSTRTVELSGNAAGRCGGRVVKVWGLAEPVELHDDADETGVDYEYLITAVRATLATAKYERYPQPENERLMIGWIGEARGMRARAKTNRGPFSVELR